MQMSPLNQPKKERKKERKKLSFRPGFIIYANESEQQLLTRWVTGSLLGDGLTFEPSGCKGFAAYRGNAIPSIWDSLRDASADSFSSFG